MYTSEALLDLHDRAHQNLQQLLAHCRDLSDEELNRELPGFGYPTVRLQLHHGIGAELYWIGVLKGVILADDDNPDYPTVESLETFREQVFSKTEEYLRAASAEELNNARSMMTWGNREQLLTPAHVFMRTLTHLYHHQGQILAMCRLLGKPASGRPSGFDFPLA
ncbi:MAG: DinB family protein [bacterium]